MKNQTLLLRIAGLISLLFVVFHLFFYRVFNWENDLGCLPNVDRAIFLTYHAICLLLLLFMGIIPISQAKALLSSSVKYGVLSLFSFFYLIRVITEFTFFGISSTSPIILIMCLVPMILYAIPLFSKPRMK
ncbi:hypothetical protein [Bacteroides ihuae]|uniref:hypothetical protein n=1 Tax=Bacteroides ihuae TaxID=1852362 RepID=UPI0011148F44|nr:hypothetical protein [Bacteroides ihuae]